MKRRLSKLCKRSLQAVGLGLLATGGYLLVLQGTDNMHATIPNELYRSAQLNEASLERFHHAYQFRSIINLRGDNTGTEWYDDEKQFAKNHGISFINFRMSAKRELSTQQVQQLIELMKDSLKPLLIHCRSGSDRTGLAVALYIAALSEADERTAEGQLSLRYGHIPWISVARAIHAHDKSSQGAPHMGA